LSPLPDGGNSWRAGGRHDGLLDLEESINIGESLAVSGCKAVLLDQLRWVASQRAHRIRIARQTFDQRGDFLDAHLISYSPTRRMHVST
jgi:hypothetical protein